MALRLGDIVLIDVRFHQVHGSKVRPAAVVLDTGDDDFVAAPITSRSSGAEFDLALQDWRKAGLNVASTVRLHKIAVLFDDYRLKAGRILWRLKVASRLKPSEVCSG